MPAAVNSLGAVNNDHDWLPAVPEMQHFIKILRQEDEIKNNFNDNKEEN